MASVRSIAKAVGVSPATVSRILNNNPDVSPETRAKVLEAVNQAGYSPKIGRRLTNVIGMIYPGEVHADLGSFDGSVLAGALRGVNEQRFDVAIVNLERDKLPHETYTQFFMRKGVRGAILRTFVGSRQVCKAVADEGFPLVVVGDRFDEPHMNYIYADSKLDSKRATEHLIQLGHRRIALALFAAKDPDHMDRYEGYREALDEHGLPFSEELIVEVVPDIAAGEKAMNKLLSYKQPPTAVYFTNPLPALGALRRTQELQLKVPGEFSIIGFDEADVRHYCFPQLTAVCQDASSLGFEAAKWLTRKVMGLADGPLRERRSTFFEINQSTGLAPDMATRVLPDGTRIKVPCE